MVKKLTAFLLLMMLTLTVALADTQVQDDAGLFTADEIAEISAICDRIESAYQVDMFVLTSQDVPSGQTAPGCCTSSTCTTGSAGSARAA